MMQIYEGIEYFEFEYFVTIHRYMGITGYECDFSATFFKVQYVGSIEASNLSKGSHTSLAKTSSVSTVVSIPHPSLRGGVGRRLE